MQKNIKKLVGIVLLCVLVFSFFCQIKVEASSSYNKSISYDSKSLNSISKGQLAITDLFKKMTRVALKSTWGDVSWEYDTDTKVLTFTSGGTLGEYKNSPLNLNSLSRVEKIVFTEKVYAPVNSYRLFVSRFMAQIKEIEGIELLDTSNVTDMSMMFAFTRYLTTTLDLSNFDTSNVTNMSHMFYGMDLATNLDLSSFDTSNVTNMSYMFFHMSSLTSLDVSGFDTSNVTNMSHMFYQSSSLTSLDVSGFDTSNVTDMSGMFYELSSLTSLDVSNFNTSNVTDMSSMFSKATSLKEIDFSTWKVNDVTNIGEFVYQTDIDELDISGFDLSKVPASDTYRAFAFDVRDIKKITLGGDYKDSNNSFDIPSLTQSHQTGDWIRESDQKNVGNTLNMLSTHESNGKKETYIVEQRPLWGDFPWSFDESIGELHLYSAVYDSEEIIGESIESPWNVDSSDRIDSEKVKKISIENDFYVPKNASYLFSSDTSDNELINLEEIELTLVQVPIEGTTFEGMFKGAKNLKSVDTQMISNELNNVVNMSSMFEGCSSITSLDLESFDTSNVTHMNKMFKDMSSLTVFKYKEGMLTPNLIEMNSIFEGVSKLQTLDLNWTVPKLKSADRAFANMTELKELDLSNLDTRNASVTQMFSNCVNLSKLTLNQYFRDSEFKSELPDVPLDENYSGQWLASGAMDSLGQSDEFMKSLESFFDSHNKTSEIFYWALAEEIIMTVNYLNKDGKEPIYESLEEKTKKNQSSFIVSSHASVKKTIDKLIESNQLTLNYDGYQPMTPDNIDYTIQTTLNGEETTPKYLPGSNFDLNIYYTGSLYIKEAPNISFGEVTRTLLGKTSVKPVKAAATNDLVMVNTTGQNNWRLTASLPKGIYNQTDDTVKLQSNLIFKKPADAGNVRLNTLPDEVATNNELTLDPLGKVNLDASFQLDVFSKNDVGDYTGSVLWSIDNVP